MKSRSALLVLVTSLTLGISAPVFAVDPAPSSSANPTRADQVTSIQAQYNPLFDAEYVRFLVVKPKLALDANTYRTYKATLVDFLGMRKIINDGLVSSTSDPVALKDFAEEEQGEFASTLNMLEAQASKITPGSICTVYKSKAIYLNKQYTCIKSGKKLVWSKGVLAKKPTPTPTSTVKPKPSPMLSRTTLVFPPSTTVSAITAAPKNMQGINDQHSFFSGGMDPAFVTLGPKTGSRPELGSYAGKTGVNFEIALGKPILAPIDARFIGFNNRNSDFRNGMDGTLQVPFDDLELCFESTSSDWPGLIYCFYHLQNSPLLLGINKSTLCSNAKEWPGPLRSEGWIFFAENDSWLAASPTSASCQGLLGREVKRGDVIAYSGTVGGHSQAPIMMKVPNKAINPTVKSGDKNLHWVQGDVFFYWKCYGKNAQFEQGVLAYPWECDSYTVPIGEESVGFKYQK